jgi:hypothetical protein
MNWRFWEKKKDVPVSAEPQNSTLYLELLPGGRLYVHSWWRRPKSEEEAVDIAKSYAALVSLLNHGHLLSTLQQAVASAGESSGMEDMSKATLAFLNDMVKAEAGEGDASNLVVPPMEAFSGD